jgi:fibronectin-binding autotransporter adhesin
VKTIPSSTRLSSLKTRFILSTAIAAVVSLVHQAGAQDTRTWNGGATPDGNWSNPTNWGGVAPDGNDVLNFAGTQNLTTTNDLTGLALSQYRIFFNAGAGNFTLGGGALTLFDFGAGNAPKIENNSTGSTQTISLASLTLDGTNGGGFAEVNPVDGNLLINSAITLAGTTQLRVWGNNGNTVTFNGAIGGGANSLALNQNSTIVLNAVNTFTGDSFINAGVLQINEGASLASAGIRIGDTSGSANTALRLADTTGGTVISSVLQARAGSSGTRTIVNQNANGYNSFNGTLTVDANLGSSSVAGGSATFVGTVLNNNSNFSLTGDGNTFMNGAITQGAGSLGSLTKSGSGLLGLNGANIFGSAATSNVILTVNGGRTVVLNAGALGNTGNLNNGKIVVNAGGAVDFNGISLTGAGKSFRIAGAGPDGRGALVNDYTQRDADSIISNVTLTGNATIGGTRGIDIGTGTLGVASGYFIDGGGFDLTSEVSARFNFRGPITNLPNLIINKGFVESEGFDWGAGTTITVNKGAHMGAFAAANRAAAGNFILNEGNIGAIGSGAATNFFTIGSPSTTVQINGESWINPTTTEFNDWAGIGGGGNIRVEGAIVGTSRLGIGKYGGATNTNTVILNNNNPLFSGKITVGGGGGNTTLQIGTGGATGDLGSSPGLTFTASTNTAPSQLVINRTGSFNLTQTLDGVGSLFIQGGVTVNMTGANTTGGSQTSGSVTTQVRQGTLILGGANVLSSRSNLVVGWATGSTTGQVKLNGFSPTVERLDDDGTTASANNRIVNDSATPVTLTFNQQNGGVVFGDFGGQLGHNTLGTANENNFGITKLGFADWTLAGSVHGYTGATVVKGGRLRLGANTTYGNGVLGSAATGTTIEPGGALDFQGTTTFTNGAGNEVLTISGRGNGFTGNGFENGALANNGTARATTAANAVILAGNASIGKNGNSFAASNGNDWDIRAVNSSASLIMGGYTLSKVGRNTVTLADIVDGVGDGDILVKQGGLVIEHGTTIDGTGSIKVQYGASLGLNDNSPGLGYTFTNSPVFVYKAIEINGSDLVNLGGSHNVSQGFKSSGDFRALNSDNAATLTLGNLVMPTRGAGGVFGTNGVFGGGVGGVVLTTINGVAPAIGRLSPGYSAGIVSNSATFPNTTFATWDGTSVQPIALTFNTTGAAITTATPTTDVLNNVGTTTIAANLTIGSLTSEQNLTVNSGALLTVATGGVMIRATTGTTFQTGVGAVGRITSGAANGELHYTLPGQLDTFGQSMRLQVVDSPRATGGFTPVTFVKHGLGTIGNWGLDALSGAPVYSQNTGGVIIDSGRVESQSGTGFGTGTIIVRDGGELSQIGGTGNYNHVFNKLVLSGYGSAENFGLPGAIRVQGNGAFTGSTTMTGDTRIGSYGTDTFAGILSGNFNFEKMGGGTLIVPSANTYTGSTTVHPGTLQVYLFGNGGQASSIGASSSAASNLVLNGGTIRYVGPGTSTDRNFTVDMGYNDTTLGTSAINNDYHIGSLNLTGSIVMSTGGDRIFSVGGLRGGTLSASIADSNAGRTAFTKNGLGTWRLTANHTFSGNVVVDGGGTLIIGNGTNVGNLGNSLMVTLSNNSDLILDRNDNFTLNQKLNVGVGTGESIVTWNGPGTLTVGGYEDNNSGAFTLNGGTLVLNKESNFNVHAVAGFLVQNAGTTRLNGLGGDQIFNGNRYILNAGTFDMNGRDEAIGDFAQALGSAGGTITNGGAAQVELRLGTSTSNVSSMFQLPNVGAQSLIQDGTGGIRLVKDGSGITVLRADNTFTGGTRVLHGQLQLGRDTTTGSIGTGAVFLGAVDGNGASLIVNRTNLLTMNQVISGPGNVQMIGTGELRLTAANTYQGLTTVRRGTLTSDLSVQDNTLPSYSNYLLEGGTLKIVGRSTGTSVQNFNPAGVVGGAALFQIAGSEILGDNNGGNLMIGLPNTWTRNTGGSVNFATAGAGTTTFSSGIANGNGIIAATAASPAYATYNGTTWAVQTGSKITGLPNSAYNLASGHADLSSGLNTVPINSNFATARLNASGGATVDLSTGTTTLVQGGMLETAAVGAFPVVVQNGTLSATSGELVVHQFNTAGDLTIAAGIATGNALTKTGPGKLIVTGGTSTNSGVLAVNQGTLQIGDGGANGQWGTGAVTNDGTLIYSRSNGTGVAPITIGGAISGAGKLIVTGGGVISANAVHTFTGGTTIENGTLIVNNFSGNVAPVVLGTTATGTGNFNVGLLTNAAAVATTNSSPIVIPNTGSTGTVLLGTSGGTAAYTFAGTVEVNHPLTLVAFNSAGTSFINSAVVSNFTAANGISGNIGTLNIDVPASLGITAPVAAVGGRRIDFQSDNTFTASVINVLNSTTLQVGSGTSTISRNQLPDNVTVNLSNPSQTGIGSTFQLNGEGEVIDTINGDIGTTIKVVAGGGAHLNLTVNGGTFNGTYDGGNTGMYIQKVGPGTLVLGGTADNPTGKVRMDSGVLQLNKVSGGSVHAVAVELTQTAGTTIITGGSLGSNEDQIFDGTVVTLHGGTLDLNGRNEAIGLLLGLGGTVTNTAPSSSSTLTIGNTAAGTSVYYGVIQDGAGGGVLGLTKANLNGLVIAGNSTYSGTTTITGGDFKIGIGGNSGSIGAGNIVTSANTTFIIDRTGLYNLPNAISGSGRYVQNLGTVTMSNTNTYTGSTTLDGGELNLTGSIAGSAVTVNEGAKLSGIGTTGALAINSGGILAPGQGGIGTLNAGPSLLMADSVFALEIGVSGDKLNVAGAATLGGPVALTLELTTAPTGLPTVYTIIDGTQPLLGYSSGARFVYNGNFLDEAEQFAVMTGAFQQNFVISYTSDGGNDVTLTVVPEPGSVALLLGGLGLLAGYRRRRA